MDSKNKQTHDLSIVSVCDIESNHLKHGAAEKAGNIVQIGFMQRSNVIKDETRSLIAEGCPGKNHQIEAHGHYNPDPGDTPNQAPTPSIDWETWCGPGALNIDLVSGYTSYGEEGNHK